MFIHICMMDAKFLGKCPRRWTKFTSPPNIDQIARRTLLRKFVVKSADQIFSRLRKEKNLASLPFNSYAKITVSVMFNGH